MNRRTKNWLQRNAKILTVCGAMVYLAIGVRDLTGGIENGKMLPNEMNTTAGPIDFKEDVSIAPITKELSTAVEPEAENRDSVIRLNMDEDDAYLLAKIAMAEAEGEDIEGKVLVVATVLNRVQSENFPDSVEAVLYERTVSGGWQFSSLTEGGRWYTTEPNEDCYKAVEMAMSESYENCGALYFESKSNSEWHRKNLEFLFQHGNHYFYKEK